MSLVTVGVLVSLATPLAEAGISVFAVSTFDTDYLLVKDGDLEKAIAALHEAGHFIRWTDRTNPAGAARPQQKARK